MVNARYKRTIDKLAGKAKVAAEARILRNQPPFYQVQLKHRVKESEQIKTLPFVVGDRVQAVRGEDKGKIGIVRSVYAEGNAFLVEGLGKSEKIVLPKEVWFQGQTSPVTNFPSLIKAKDLRLVTKLRNDDGTEEDVAIHSIKFRGKIYDQDTNTFRPIRRAAHDESMIIPYPAPAEPLKTSDESMATSADVVDQKTYFPHSLVESPIPMGAVDQFRNIYSRFKRDRYAPKISEEDLARFKKPEMPITPATKELLAKLADLPPKPSVEFTKETEDFISKEIEKGLEKQKQRATAALGQYQ